MNAAERLGRTLAGRRLPGLDGLRAIAVLLVIAYHAKVLGIPGGHGVLLFFVLSGFLITRLLVMEEARTGGISLRDFYARRSLRIFPAFYVYTAVVLAYWVLTHKPILWSQTWASLLYVNNYYQAIAGDPNTALSHTWSLAIEEQFYLLWPGLFLLLRNNRRRLHVTLGIVLAVWAARAYRAVVLGTPDGYIYEALDTRIDHLLIGCALALALSFPGALRRLANLTATGPRTGAVVLLVVLSVWIADLLPRWYREAVGFSTDPVLFAVLILQVLALFPAAWIRWLEWPWVRYLGRISYPLYLYQQIVIGGVEKRLVSAPPLFRFAVVAAACVAAASVSYFVVEKPALQWKRRFERVPATTP